jgi:hypothetical protein
VDCIFVKSSQVFLVILSNSTLVSVPKNATNQSEYLFSTWPIQPLKIHHMANDQLYLLCEGGWCCQIRVSDDATVANGPSLSSSQSAKYTPATVLSSCAVGNNTLSFLLRSGPVTTVSEAPSTGNGRRKSKKITAASPAATVSPSVSLVLIDTTNFSENTWENIQSEELDHRVTLPLTTTTTEVEGSSKSGEGASDKYLLCAHNPTSAVSVIFPNSSSSAYKWLKVSKFGEILLSVEISGSAAPSFALGTENTLCLLSSSSFSLWNIHYGVAYPQNKSKSSSFSSSFSPLFRVASDQTLVVYSGSNDRDVNEEEAPVLTKTCTLSRSVVTIEDSIALQVMHSDLSSSVVVTSPQLSLGAMIGTSKKRSVETEFLPTASHGSRTRRKSSATEDGILNRLDESKRKILLKTLSSSEGKGNYEEQTAIQTAAISFLRCCETVVTMTPKLPLESVLQIWTEADWQVLETLLKMRMVSLGSSPALFPFLLEAANASFHLRSFLSSHPLTLLISSVRFPLLLSLAKYSLDLTELQAIKLISLVALAAESSTSPHESHSQSEGAGKKRRKSSAKIAEGSPEAHPQPAGCQSLERLSLLLDALLYRKHGFNSSVLSEVTGLLPLPIVAILLRLLANMLHGVANTQQPWRLPVTSLTASASSSSSVPPQQTPYLEYNDGTLGNIITWLESLLESHHTAILFSIKSSPTSSLTEALVSLVRVIKDLPSAMTIVETTVGIALHHQRQTKYHSKLLPSQQLQLKKEKKIQYSDSICNDNYQLEVVRFY